MADNSNCPNCCKALAKVAWLSSDRMTTFRCDCAEPEPTLADVLGELKAIHAILKRAEDHGLPVVTISA